MPLPHDYKEIFYGKLKDCVLMVRDHEAYEKVFDRYEKLKKEINAVLENRDSLCTDCERLIDKASGGLKREAALIAGDDPELTGMLTELAGLHSELRELEARRGWNDSAESNLDVVIAIAGYSGMEDEIIAELGRDEGRRVIYEQKKEILKLEEERGVTFFADQVERLEALFRISVLYPTEGEIRLTDGDNLLEEELVLMNGWGERLHFDRSAQMRRGDRIYLELILREELNIRGLNYYTVEETPNGQRLTLEEDKSIYDELFERYEQLEVLHSRGLLVW